MNLNVGIDFSIKSPGMTIRTVDGIVNFYTFPRIGTAKEDTLAYLRDCDVHVHQLADEHPLPSKATIAERERSSLVDADMQTDAIVSAINGVRFVEHSTFEERIFKLAIEGFSFGSTGNRLAQISGYQWLLRYKLKCHCKLEPNHLHIYSPMTVKAVAGKGNFKKEQMIEAFINSDDPSLQAHPFWLKMKESPEIFQTKKGNWLKPIDDIIDSYWVMRTLELNTSDV